MKVITTKHLSHSKVLKDAKCAPNCSAAFAEEQNDKTTVCRQTGGCYMPHRQEQRQDPVH